MAHHGLVAEQNHARREAITLALSETQNFMGTLPDRLRRELADLFRKLSTEDADGGSQRALAMLIAEALALESVKAPAAD